MLTKTDIAAIRRADDITVHLDSRNPNGLVRLIKRNRPFDRDPFAKDQEHILTATAELYGHRGQSEMKAGLVSCFAMAGIYHNQGHHVSLALKSLRAGDEITFVFWPDAHTNGYVAMSGLHADILNMNVRRNGKTVAHWHITESICPSNSARMCRGIPNSESYARDAAGARQCQQGRA